MEIYETKCNLISLQKETSTVVLFPFILFRF